MSAGPPITADAVQQLLTHLDDQVRTSVARVRELYGWHFPELSALVRDGVQYLRVCLCIGRRPATSNSGGGSGSGSSDEAAAALVGLSDVVPDPATCVAVEAAARNSMGVDLADEDLTSIFGMCRRTVAAADYRTQIQDYLRRLQDNNAPASCMPAPPAASTGTDLSPMAFNEFVAAMASSSSSSAAADAGSSSSSSPSASLAVAQWQLRQQAQSRFLPASTMQILGAEKALFRALKTKRAVQKYGLVTNVGSDGGSGGGSSDSGSGPRHKGKVARCLAQRTSLAARLDTFSPGSGPAREHTPSVATTAIAETVATANAGPPAAAAGAAAAATAAAEAPAFAQSADAAGAAEVATAVTAGAVAGCRLCRHPFGLSDTHGVQVQCGGCWSWFHAGCLSLQAVPAGDWFCPNCVRARGSGSGDDAADAAVATAAFPDADPAGPRATAREEAAARAPGVSAAAAAAAAAAVEVAVAQVRATLTDFMAAHQEQQQQPPLAHNGRRAAATAAAAATTTRADALEAALRRERAARTAAEAARDAAEAKVRALRRQLAALHVRVSTLQTAAAASGGGNDSGAGVSSVAALAKHNEDDTPHAAAAAAAAVAPPTADPGPQGPRAYRPTAAAAAGRPGGGGCTTLFLGNLAVGVCDDDVYTLADQVGASGSVRSIRWLVDRNTGAHKGCGFVEFHRAEDADRFFAALNSTNLHGRPLRIDFARPRAPRPQQQQEQQ